MTSRSINYPNPTHSQPTASPSTPLKRALVPLAFLALSVSPLLIQAQEWKLTPENIQLAIDKVSDQLAKDPMRPAFHLTPPAGCMGDPNGGIYHDGWYHIFYGQHPFAHHPGGWYWAHARSKDLLHWERLPPRLTPDFDLGLSAIGSGSTIVTEDGRALAFHSSSEDGADALSFWQVEFTDETLNEWEHLPRPANPVLTLDHPGLPPFDGFWRDPFVFAHQGRTFLIACADLFEEDYVPVPIFEASNKELTEWDYKGILFTYPKHKLRNLEVPEFRRLGDKWILMASSDAPVDRCYYFVGDFNLDRLEFVAETEGVIDHSGHYYAQETIQDDTGDLYLMGWLPGWDRDWLPKYRNLPLKNSDPLWNGVFALPRQLSLSASGKLIQKPVDTLKRLRGKHWKLPQRKLPVDGPTTGYSLLDEVKGDQLELQIELALDAASFCGFNLLADDNGHAGFFLQWSGNMLEANGVRVPLPEWKPGESLKLQVFLDKRWVEIFINDGQHCVSAQVDIDAIKGDRIALTSLGGTGRLVSLEAWKMSPIQQ